MDGLMDHLEACKDLCDRFGSSVAVFGVSPLAGKGDAEYAPVPGFLVKRFGSGVSDDDDDDWDGKSPCAS